MPTSDLTPMNIRGVTNPVIPAETQQKVESPGVKMNESHQDRDADGRRQDEEPDKNPLNEEEMQKAKSYLEELDGLKSNNLTYTIEITDSVRIFLIKDLDGNVVRRIPEHEMRYLVSHKDESSGKIFSRTG